MSDEEGKTRMSGDNDHPQGAELIYKNVLDNVASGVMSVDAKGVVTTFNEAAAEICNMTAQTVVGQGFFEVFSQEKDADEFIDIIFSAVYDSSTVHQCVVEATLGGRKRSLSMATRFLEEERDGKTVRIGVVAMFNDISEIRELREKELRLAEEVEAKHTELREAYLDLEETNRKLGKAARKMNVVRMVAATAVPVLFIAMGLYFWDTGPHVEQFAESGVPDAISVAPEDVRTLVVEPQRLTSTITILGRLAPKREIEVVSPMKGKIGAVYVRPGQRVIKGQLLAEMDVGEVRIKHREARVAYIKANEQVKKLEDWSNHADVSRVRRAVSKSKVAVEFRKSRLAETTFLLEQGIIPASEHEAAEREHRNQLLDLRAAEQELQAVLDRGIAELKVARLELDNASAQLKRIEDILDKATVTAPIAGVILRPKENNLMAQSSEKQDKLTKGTSMERGDLLVRIGDLEGLSVVGYVDEVDVSRIRQGHSVRIAGDAFPGIVLHGEIERVSSEAVLIRSGSRLPTFEVTAVVASLTGDQRRLLRLGMTAMAEVVVYENKNALLVPVEAVAFADKQPRLRIRNLETGEVKEVKVVAGMTTLDSVEIIDGISPGDEVLIGGHE